MDLPQSVQEIADVIGRDKALFLIGQLPQCGKRSWRANLYVPKRLKPDHQLVKLLGWKDANRMAREFGGMILQPSNCRHLHRQFRNASIHRMADEGMTVDQIAFAVDLTPRQVRNVLRQERPPEEMAPANDNTAPTQRHEVIEQ